MQQFWVAASLLWLAGVGLRLTILAVPPVIALMQADLGLSGTQIGILSGLPVILFGIAAVPGSLLIARFGAWQALVVGLVIAGIASGLRGSVDNVYWLYATTIVMSAGIAVMQPALPPLVRQWMPQRVSFGTALFTNGLLVGETLPVMLMIPLIFPLVQDSWRWGLAAWGVPLILIALFIAAFAPRLANSTVSAPTGVTNWWPDWSDKVLWQAAILLGAVNSIYFGSNAFLPAHLTQAGRPDLISVTLTALNFGQLPASFILLAVARRLERRAWPFVVAGLMMLACIVGMVSTASGWTVFYAGALGFIGAVVLTLGLALPALLCAPENVARMAAAMFTIGYSEGLVISVLGGVAWDVAGDARFAFLPQAAAALPLIALPPFVGFFRRASGKA